MNIIFLGLGGHFNVLFDILSKKKKFNLYGVHSLLNENILNKYKFRSLSKKQITDLNPKKYILVNAIGFNLNNKNRKKMFNEFKKIGFNFLTVIHPSATISNSATISEGAQILTQSSIMPNVHIGKNCVINTNSSVDHDSRLDDNVNLSPNSTICGNVYIKQDSYIGASSTILNNLTIGKSCHVFPGSVVNKNIKDKLKYINGRIIAK
tara:strand:- start:4584 stop:5207 length:624 start_codon:yes stop_codon:yes gene_type:complete